MNVEAGGTFIRGTSVHALKSAFSFQGVDAVMDMANGDISLEPASGRYVLAPSNVVNIGSTAPPSTNLDLNLDNTGVLSMKERTSNPTADANYHKIFSKDDDILYHQDGAGTINNLLASGIVDIQQVRYTGHAGYGSTNTKIAYFTTEDSNVGPSFASFSNDSTNGLSITAGSACNPCWASFTWFARTNNVATNMGLSLNSSQLTTDINSITQADILSSDSIDDSASDWNVSATWSGYITENDVVRPHGDAGAFVSSPATFTAAIFAVKDAILTSQEANDSMVRLHTTNGHGSTNTKIRRFSTTVTNTGTAITYADSATNGSSFTINETGVYHISYTDVFNTGAFFGLSLNSSQLTTNILGITTADRLLSGITENNDSPETVSWQGILAKDDIIRPHTHGDTDSTNTERGTFTITKLGFNALSAVKKESIAVISDTKTDGTAGGTFTSGSWQTRDLNTENSDVDSIVSISSNQFTLGAGTYHLHGHARGQEVGDHQTRIRNITDSTTDILGSNANAASGATRGTDSFINGIITLTGTKTFELQHYGETTRATDGFGTAVSNSEQEVYSELTIRKLP